MTRSTLIVAVCILAGVVFLSGLGLWQVQRLGWKEAMIARVEAGLEQPPVPLAEIERLNAAGEDIEYRPVTLTGRFLHDAESHYFATFKGQPGYHVYTPTVLPDDRIIIVNRGFVPIDRKERDTRSEGQIEGFIEITGLARSAPAEKPNSLVPDNDLAKNIFYWKSLSEMLSRLPDKTDVQPLMFFVDSGDAPNPGGLPVGGVTRITFPNNHLQYAITWFALAAALLVVGTLFLRSRMRGSTA